MTNRRRPRGHAGKSPAGRSAQSRAPAARGDRRGASSKQGRAASAHKAAVRRRQRAAVVAVAVSIRKPVVVNFFASWCTACQAELPGFRQEASALKGKVTFIGVDSLETGDKNFLPNLFHLAGAFAALARDVGPDGGGLHAALGGGNTMPLTAFYGADGRLLDVERAALVPVGALQIKIAQLYGVSS